ncbi:MAG TPA: heme-binding protein [Gemmatimonadaceae bacterium]|nr:heme-binding protein [Gemmatimonadaceae bacterium]
MRRVIAWSQAATFLVALAACKNSNNEKGSLDTTNAKSPRVVAAAGCDALPSATDLGKYLKAAPDSGEAGGLFHGRAEWGALVNRSGQICAVVPPSDSTGGYWPGSRAISMAKAFTANGFSTDTAAMSTARLYTFTQPGHSLWGVSQPAPFNPQCLDPNNDIKICGGAIAFGGGVPLYKNGRIVGGLGISGDTPCADHEIAKRVRHFAGLDPAKGPAVDDIQYSKTDRPSIYTHPLCPNTWRNGQKIGDEPAAVGY